MPTPSGSLNGSLGGGGGDDDLDRFLGCWKQNLFLLQEGAPRPQKVSAKSRNLENVLQPPFYDDEFHGWLDRNEAERLLREVGEGAYLVRASQRSESAYTLCMLFDGRVFNYKLFFDGAAHYVGEKRFDTIELLVADGLISMYIDKHASEYIQKMAEEAVYEESPYSQHARFAKSAASISRVHDFEPHTFRMPHYCDYCRNFMWGLVQQGVRCRDCGFAAHRRCADVARADCRPDAKYLKRVFAVDLTTLCLALNVTVPPVLSACISEVERRGISVEGIYRVSGSHELMEKLRRAFDTNAAQPPDLCQVEDIHAVAGLLKLYLRQLPQQLVPFSVYKSLLSGFSSARTDAERQRACRRSLAELPALNASTLVALLSHLRKVADAVAQNKMSAENLATIFSPTLFCTGPTPALPQQQHCLLHFLIRTPAVMMRQEGAKRPS